MLIGYGNRTPFIQVCVSNKFILKNLFIQCALVLVGVLFVGKSATRQFGSGSALILNTMTLFRVFNKSMKLIRGKTTEFHIDQNEWWIKKIHKSRTSRTATSKEVAEFFKKWKKNGLDDYR